MPAKILLSNVVVSGPMENLPKYINVMIIAIRWFVIPVLWEPRITDKEFNYVHALLSMATIKLDCVKKLTYFFESRFSCDIMPVIPLALHFANVYFYIRPCPRCYKMMFKCVLSATVLATVFLNYEIIVYI